MYYGDYTDAIVASSSTAGAYHYYNMELAYLFTFGAYFLIYFLVIAVRLVSTTSP